MKVAIRWIGFVLALAFLALTFVNASWLAKGPRGQVKLIAHRGAHQQFAHNGMGRGTCTAKQIEPPVHDFVENTLPSIAEAGRNGAAMVEVDVSPTSDGHMVLFHGSALDCRTDGKGDTRGLALEQIKALDAGYGYSADGGRTFPLRGQGVGLIPTVEEAASAAGTKPLLYHFQSNNAREADQLAAALRAAGRNPQALGDGFYGDAAPVARILALFPKAWTFTMEAAKACSSDYVKLGWLGITPESCRGGTLFVPTNRAWLYAGWPNRLIARMEAVGARIVIVGPQGEGEGEGAPSGLDLPEQIREIPAGYNGYVWVEDIWALGPALHPAFGKRNPAVDAAYEAQLEARRAARD